MSINDGNFVLREETKKALSRLRASGRDYDQLSEVDLLSRLHEEFYSDLSEEDFLSRVSRPWVAPQTPKVKFQGDKLRLFAGVAVLALLVAAIGWDNFNQMIPSKEGSFETNDSNDASAIEDNSINQIETPCVVDGDQLELTPEECARFKESEGESVEKLQPDSTAASEASPVPDQIASDAFPRGEIPNEIANALPMCPADDAKDWDQCTAEITFPDNRTYKGQWMNDDINGDGVMTYPDGGEYRGSFKNGLRHGEGTMVYPDGRKKIGRWEDDNFIA